MSSTTSFGGPRALAEARAALAARGVRLLLDYVPNHVAPDHPWVTSHPELFVKAARPTSRPNRQPGFGPEGTSWPTAATRTSRRGPMSCSSTRSRPRCGRRPRHWRASPAQCDGIRCDMAMLMTNQVFAKTWAGRAGPEPGEEFWPAVIAGMRARHPDTVLVAEAYWDMEWDLHSRGSTSVTTSGSTTESSAGTWPAVRDHLRADLSYQRRAPAVPGEPRRAPHCQPIRRPKQSPRRQSPLPPCPGATLWHEGQFEGRRVRPPVFLSRRPDETVRSRPGRAGTGGCWPPWPGPGTGGRLAAARDPAAGPTTIPAATSSPGPGP